MASDFTLRLITQRAAGGDPIIRERQVSGASLNVGRSVENDIVLADLSVDPRHARITAAGPGRVLVETVGGLPFVANGKSVQRAEFDVAAKPQLAFGGYTLSLEPAADGGILVTVTRVEPERAPDPSVFSLQARIFSRRRMAWVLGLTVLALCLIVPLFLSDLFRGAKIRPDQQWSSGPLSEAHAFLEKDCNACHQKAFVAVRDQACLSCHAKTAPGGQLAADQRVRSLGSPFRPVPVAEHGIAGFSAAEMHKRLIKGEPPSGGWVERVQTVFNHPTDRCASCHVEHTHATAGAQAAQATATPRQEKPTLIVVRDCQACHSQLKMRLKDTTLIDTPNWEKHPRFRPQVTRGGRDAPGPRLWLTSNPREETGLIFPHDTHLNPLGGPARQAIGLGRTHPGAGPVTCTSCHERQGEGFRPVEMERDCEACHSLAFDSRGGALVKLPHEEPAKVMAFLTNFYGGGGAAAGVYRTAFSSGGACVDCHTISWRGAEAVVAPVHLSQSFMPRSGFNHAIEQHGAKSVDEKVCRDCHRSAALNANPAAVAAQPWRVSSNASDLMMPDKADCANCHGNAKASKADSAPADCKTCHSFHTPGQATCEPGERPITVRSWTVNEPPKCLPHPRRYATALPPKG